MNTREKPKNLTFKEFANIPENIEKFKKQLNVISAWASPPASSLGTGNESLARGNLDKDVFVVTNKETLIAYCSSEKGTAFIEVAPAPFVTCKFLGKVKNLKDTCSLKELVSYLSVPETECTYFFNFAFLHNFDDIAAALSAGVYAYVREIIDVKTEGSSTDYEDVENYFIWAFPKSSNEFLSDSEYADGDKAIGFCNFEPEENLKDITISGEYAPATWEDPEEFPEIDIRYKYDYPVLEDGDLSYTRHYEDGEEYVVGFLEDPWYRK